ncbi:hypothetical protein C4D60_Mb05t28670 [Musa balbisiana]|uniref:Rapid ALkalinization Factor n=1 Tax=Musa balbisiana TaxID=52838 RepID=A0A4S8JZI7_MUSBA|nr:hypothetical protein C4D60_Mb05t28670 [Musa balbisiana]
MRRSHRRGEATMREQEKRLLGKEILTNFDFVFLCLYLVLVLILAGRELEAARRMIEPSTKINNGDRIPCNPRDASKNNCRPGSKGNPYNRGCNPINKCRVRAGDELFHPLLEAKAMERWEVRKLHIESVYSTNAPIARPAKYSTNRARKPSSRFACEAGTRIRRNRSTPALGDGGTATGVRIGLSSGLAVVVGGAGLGAGGGVGPEGTVADVTGGGKDAAAHHGSQVELLVPEALHDGAAAPCQGGDPAKGGLLPRSAGGGRGGQEDRKWDNRKG